MQFPERRVWLRGHLGSAKSGSGHPTFSPTFNSGFRIRPLDFNLGGTSCTAAISSSRSPPAGCRHRLPGVSLANAPDAIIEEAWQAANRYPLTFYVSSWGTISFGNDETWRKSRSELLGLMPVTNRAGLFELADKNWRFASILEDRIPECAIDGTIGDADWQVWLGQVSDDAAGELIALANDWIDDDADESDWELADLRGYSDRGAALTFFRDEFEFCDTFNVVIVEGDHPGSSYFAAELRMDVDEANALANQHGIPIRFEWSGE